jgi:DNA-binding MarR family transcriptional regulator
VESSELAGLDDRVLAAIERLAQARRSLQQDIATELGLSPLQLDVLLSIQSPNVECRVGAIAIALDVEGSTVTDAANALVRKGHVLHRADPLDGRRKVLSLTPKGRAVISKIGPRQAAATEALAGLDERRKAFTLGVLLDVVAGLHQAGVLGVDRSCKTCRFHQDKGGPAGYCLLLQISLGHPDLRVDCPEHQPRAKSSEE